MSVCHISCKNPEEFQRLENSTAASVPFHFREGFFGYCKHMRIQIAKLILITISANDIGSVNFQFRVRVDGNQYNAYISGQINQ